jgi:hypothetical protein
VIQNALMVDHLTWPRAALMLICLVGTISLNAGGHMIRYWIQITLLVLLVVPQTACLKRPTTQKEKPKQESPYKPADEFMNLG